MSMRVHLTWLIALLGIATVITLGVLFPFDRNYYFISLAVVVLAMLPFVAAFEGRKPEAREIVVIAVMTALAVSGRAAFFMIPQFKPGMAIVILAGVSLGKESGFIVGALHGFISNFLFGQGPWTPWQMFGYALCGFFAGVFFAKAAARRSGVGALLVPLVAYGAVSTFLIYGFLVDTASVLMWASDLNWASVSAIYLSGVIFNAIHALASAVFLTLLSTLIVEKLTRLKNRYGMLEPV